MKRPFVIFLYFAFLVLLVEFGLGYGGYWVIQGEPYSYEEVKQERRDLVQRSPERLAANLENAKPDTRKRNKHSVEILHPYLGYIVDFRDDDCPDIGFCDDRMRGYKDMLQGKPFLEYSPDRVIVVIIGGSFAYGVSNNAVEGKLINALSTLPQFQEKEIIVYTFALGGFKQPQQLFAIQYYLSMGAHFDMIINIDGFNEIVLSQTENLPFNTNPFFPRMWHERIHRGSEDRLSKSFHGLQAYLNKQRRINAEKENSFLLRRSAVSALLWRLEDNSLKKQIMQAEVEYLEKAKTTPRVISALAITGTSFDMEDFQSALERIASFWRRTSETLHAVAIANDIEYYHFLQPNQYVVGSKPMSEEEKKIAFLEGSDMLPPYKEAATRGYPYLIEEGKKLQASAVPFWDLTPLFKDKKEVLYMDSCCHLNAQGYGYVIDEIVNSIKSVTLVSNN